MTTAIWWIRRDLCLQDNQALQTALDGCDRLIPLFVLDPSLPREPAPVRQGFLYAYLHDLDQSLRQRGSRLVIRHGQPLDILSEIKLEFQITHILAEADISPYARHRDSAIAAALPLTPTGGLTIHPPGSVRKPDGTPYSVFTPFLRAWQALPLSGSPLPAPDILPPLPDCTSGVLPEFTNSFYIPASSKAAHDRFNSFVDGAIFHYNTMRHRVDLDGTSLLSPYLRFGVLSARQAAHAARNALSASLEGDSAQGCSIWLTQLVWRDFYYHILTEHPNVLQEAFRPDLRAIPWRDSPTDLTAWQHGLTGYPIVDASMRQLLETSWMHNRARMITASFLCKDLLISWQEGELWFMRHLLDGDPANNNGGWQWTAGTGTDAAPYFRIFNPVLQGKKFDPHGDYVRRWVPELKLVPQAFIHTPWLMPPDVQSACGLVIGRDYPAPIVDHSEARKRALAAYQSSRKGS